MEPLYTRKDVLEMVDAVFHEFASSYKSDAIASVSRMMDRREEFVIDPEHNPEQSPDNSDKTPHASELSNHG